MTQECAHKQSRLDKIQKWILAPLFLVGGWWCLQFNSVDAHTNAAMNRIPIEMSEQDVSGKRWVFTTHYDNSILLFGPQVFEMEMWLKPWLEIHKGSVRLFDGCNEFSGTISDSTLVIDQPALTDRTCTEITERSASFFQKLLSNNSSIITIERVQLAEKMRQGGSNIAKPYNRIVLKNKGNKVIGNPFFQDHFDRDYWRDK